MPFLETSAKSSTNVEQAFMLMASEIKKRLAGSTAVGGRPGAAGAAQGGAMRLDGRAKPVRDQSSGCGC